MFYPELARRVVALANALQHDNAAALLTLALDAKDWGEDPPPLALREAWGDFLVYRVQTRRGAPNYGLFESGIKQLEAYLATENTE